MLAVSGTAATLLALAATVTGRSFGNEAMAQVVGNVFYRSGWIESHGLAAVVGVALLLATRTEARRPWHVVALATHALLGGTNLLCWEAASAPGMHTMAVGTTVMHAAWVTVHALAFAFTGRSAANEKP